MAELQTISAQFYLREVLQLSSLQIPQSAFGFQTTTMESEKYVCVRVAEGDQPSVVIVDMEDPSNPIRRPMKAEAVMMHPDKKILALRAGTQMQVFNLELQGPQAKLKSFNMPEKIDFWTWVNVDVIGIITRNAVFHWSITDANDPVKFCDRNPAIAEAQTQVIDYKCSPKLDWGAVVVISAASGKIQGKLQLYSVAQGRAQVMSAHACAFHEQVLEGNTKPSLLFVFASRTPEAATFRMTELNKQADMRAYTPKAVDIYFPPEFPGDFPIAIVPSARYGILFVLTKMGYVHLYDAETSTRIYMNRICADAVFTSCFHRPSNGVMAINKTGQVLLIGVEDSTIVNYISSTLSNSDLAMKIASRANLAGAEGLVMGQFQQMINSERYREAAELAAKSPGNALRTVQTISLFQSAPQLPGQQSPLIQYFQVLLELGKLNRQESLELVRPVLQQQKKQLLEKWLREDKLECSEELGDLVKQYDNALALSVYLRAKVPEKVVQCFAEQGAFDKIVLYAQKADYRPDYSRLLSSVLAVNPAQGQQFGTLLYNNPGGSLIDLNTIVDLFIQRQLIQEVTSFLLDVLKDDRPEDGPMQTRLLELNLIAAPHVADAILTRNIYSHYDHAKIASLCEKAGLAQRALENYTDLADIKRVIVHTHLMTQEWIVNFFGTMSVEDSLECLDELLRSNIRQNLKFVVAVAAKYAEQLTAETLIQMFEQYHSFEGLFLFLNAIVNTSEDPEVHFKYIEAAAKVGQFKEVERMCKESTVFDPERVRDFLKAANLADQLPLIVVCDRFDFVGDMTQYLHAKGLTRYIEVYVKNINPSKLPEVVGSLLDAHCNEDFIKMLVMSVRSNRCSVEELVNEVEKRHRLKLLETWLEARIAAGNQETATHNALAKIYIDSNKDPEAFLVENQFYDSKEIGAYAEKRDPLLAVTAYKRGFCDQELIEVTNKHGLFKAQSRYLVERQDPEIWAIVLDENSEFRRKVIEQTVQTALPESENPEEVSATVKAFMTANLPKELIELLEKIVLEGGKFNNNKNLQNLLILTAIRADKTRVMDYINRLDNYDAPDIANIAVGAELYEEAFVCYRKKSLNVSAITVLIDHIRSIERAYEFAARVGEVEVWSKLGKAQLDRSMVREAIDSFIKADDPKMFNEVIDEAESTGDFEDLVRYLLMCRSKELREPKVESELVYSFAKTNRLADLEEFISTPNIAALQNVGDRCYMEGLYEAARLLFDNIQNYGRLASALVKLEEYQAAVEAARKANSVRCWKEVCFACVDAEQFRLAQLAGINIIIHPDELDELIRYYEQNAHFEELIQLLEKGISQERAHAGIFTDLGVVYAKYKPEKLMDYIKPNWSRMHVPKVLKAAEACCLWEEVVFLYIHNDDFDPACMTMIMHPVDAWDHILFLEVVTKVVDPDKYYKALAFYLDQAPMKINELLRALTPKIDHQRVVSQMRKHEQLPLIKPYLESVQEHNLPLVNEALNEVLLEEEEFHALRESIDSYDKFDQLGLAQQLERHELIEFRRISAYLFKLNKRWNESIALSKRDKLYKDAMETAAESRDVVVAEGLLNFFVQIESKECFAACLFVCYDLIRPDVAMELAWRHKIMDFAMPFLIQVTREYYSKVDMLVKANDERERKEKTRAEEEAKQMTQVAPVQEMDVLQTGMMPLQASLTGVSVDSGFAPAMGTVPGLVPAMMMGMDGSGVGPTDMSAFGGGAPQQPDLSGLYGLK